MRRWMSATALAALAAAAASFPAAADLPKPLPGRATNDVTQNKNSYQVGYAHLDTQWRWSYLDTIGEFLPNTLHKNFDLFDKYPDYVFNFTGSRRYLMMKQYYPADYARMKEYVKKGRWYPTGSSVDENDVNSPSPESIIRNVLYGNHYFQKEFGFAPMDYILPDCFGFPASLPSILAHAGAKGFSTQKLTWGSAAGIPFTVGVWEGLDGKQVIAALDGGGYGANVTEDLSQSQFLLDRINKIGDQSGAYVDYRYYGTGDQGGATSDSSVNWVETSIHGKGPVHVISAPADQMFHDLTNLQVSKLPRYKGDLELTQHSAGSITSQAYMKRWNRKNELLADSAERASVAADWLGGTPYPRDKFLQSWYLILGNQMHDIIPGTSIPKAYEFSWNDEVVALNQSAATLTNAVGAITRGMDTRAKGISVAVYNPLSIAREDVVQAKIRFPLGEPRAVRVFGPSGEVPSQIVQRGGGDVDVLFLARVPSVGVAMYDVRPSAVPYGRATGLRVSKSTLENARYRVTLNGNGDVAQVYDKAAKHNLLSGPARLAFKFEEPEQYPAWNMDWKDQSQPPTGYVDGPATVRVVENGPVRVALEVTRHSEGSTFVQRIRLAAAGAGSRVEWDNAIDWNTMKHTLKAVFPLAVSNEMATYNLGFGTIQRSTDDPKKYEVVSRQWFDLTNTGGDYGVSVLEDCKYGSDKPDDHTLRLTLIRTPSARSYPDQGTQDIGHHQVVYALEGHQGDWRKGGTHWEGARLNQPLMAFQTPSHAGPWGRTFALVHLNTNQVQITALKKAEDSNDVVVRLQEIAGGAARSVRLTAASPIVAAREVNGQEIPIGKAVLKNGALTLDMTKYSARAFTLKLGSPAARVTATASKPVALPYNLRAATAPGEAASTGFDGQGHTIAADLMPAQLVSEGVAFRMGPAASGRKNAVACQGQSIRLPSGAFNEAYVLAAANGDQRGAFRVDGKPVSLTVQDWSGFIGQWDDRVFTPENTRRAQPLEGNIYGLRPAFIKRDPAAWVGEHRHTADGGNDIYAYSYVFRYRIPMAAGAKTLTLPNNPNIRVFAVSLASNAGGAQPAQPLYDAPQPPVATPSFTPEAGTYKDSIAVDVRPSLYVTDATYRYTTDGSTPTASSPAAGTAMLLSQSADIKVRAFHPDGTAGAVTEARYDLNDTTPPAVTRVGSAEASPIVRVVFSEPVDPATAENAANYRFGTGVSVQSAEMGADGRSVNLTVSPAMAAENSYALTVTGVKDRSPAGNTSGGAGFLFTVAAPVFRFTVDAGGNALVNGTAADSTLRIMGAPAPIGGPAGPALTFNGTNDGVMVRNSDALNPTQAITVAAWVQATDWDGNRRIAQKGRDDSQYRLLAEDGVLKFDIAGVGTATAPLPSVSRWHHIAGTYDGATVRLYVDGELVGSGDGSGPLPTTGDGLGIGTNGPRTPEGDHFHGQISDVRIYDQAFLPEHIRALYQRNVVK